MAKVAQTPPLKQFREQVEHYIKEVEDSVGFPTDEEWLTLVLSKLLEFSDPVNTGDLALLGAMIEVWGRRTVARTE